MNATLALALVGLWFSSSVAQAAAPGGAVETVVSPDRVAKLEQEVAALRRDLGELRLLLEQVAKQEPALQAGGLEQRVKVLETTSAELGKSAEALSLELRAQGDNLGSLSLAEQKRPQLNVYGTFNVVDTSNAHQTFDAEAFELVFSGQPHERLGFFAEIEFERAATVGGARGGEVLVEQAYATLTLAPRLNLRAGVLLVPFGNFNVDHYAPNRDVISKPLVSYVVAPSDWTDNGLGLQGSLLVGSADDSLAYEIYALAGLDATISALGTRAARQSFGEDNNNDKAWVGRLAWNHGGNFELGISAYTGEVDAAGRDRLNGWAVDVLARRGPLTVTGEFDRLEADHNLLEGWYTRATYRLPTSWFAGGWHARLFPESHLDLVAQYDHAHVEGPLNGVFEINREWRRTLGINYHPSHQWVLKLHREHSEASRRPLQFGNQHAWLGSIGFQF